MYAPLPKSDGQWKRYKLQERGKTFESLFFASKVGGASYHYYYYYYYFYCCYYCYYCYYCYCYYCYYCYY